MTIDEMTDVMQHYKNGGSIRCRRKNGDAEWRNIPTPSWNWSGYEYEKVERILWTSKDVPMNCWIRHKEDKDTEYLIYKITPKRICTAANTYTYAELAEFFEHTTDGIDWKPCYGI